MSAITFWIVLIFLFLCAARHIDYCDRSAHRAGRARETKARGTLAYWTRDFSYRLDDFTPRGRRYWRATLVLVALTVAWAVLGVALGVWR